jgi:mediator of RNA polymerase II transcription subunit 21
MFASIRYIDTHHPYSAIDGQSDQSPATTAITQPSQQTQSTQQESTQPSSDGLQPQQPQEPPRDTPAAFEAVLVELAQDLIVKQQQIEFLIDTLPGLGNSQASQEERIRDLELELREVEMERKKWVSVQEGLVGKVEGKIKGIRRV